MPSRLNLLITGAVLLGIGAVVLLLTNAEPRYKGRTLSQWIKASAQASDEREAREAIVIIATNSAPLLVRWVSEDLTPRWSLNQKLPARIRSNRFVRRFIFREREGRHAGMATKAFEVAGTNAAPAVPGLAELVTARHPLTVRLHALYLLSLIGPPALGPLRQAATDPETYIRVAAVGGIKRLGTNASDAIPELKTALADPDIYVRQNATQALEILAPNALTNPPSPRY